MQSIQLYENLCSLSYTQFDI